MKYIYLLIFFASISINLDAQDEPAYLPGFWGYSYDVSLPMGDSKDFVGSGLSFRGFTIGGRKMIKKNVSIGGSIGWHVFNDKMEDVETPFDFTLIFEDESEDDISGSLTGTQFRYINSFPFMVNAHYYSNDPVRSSTTFYGGLSIGAMAIKNRVEVGVLAIDDTNWHLGIVPEIGIFKRINTVYYINAGLRYNHAFSSGDVKHSYLNFSLGVFSEI
jgi:hypothetical protein